MTLRHRWMTTGLAVATVGALTLTGCTTTASPEEPAREAGANVDTAGGTASTIFGVIKAGKAVYDKASECGRNKNADNSMWTACTTDALDHLLLIQRQLADIQATLTAVQKQLTDFKLDYDQNTYADRKSKVSATVDATKVALKDLSALADCVKSNNKSIAPCQSQLRTLVNDTGTENMGKATEMSTDSQGQVVENFRNVLKQWTNDPKFDGNNGLLPLMFRQYNGVQATQWSQDPGKNVTTSGRRLKVLPAGHMLAVNQLMGGQLTAYAMYGTVKMLAMNLLLLSKESQQEAGLSVVDWPVEAIEGVAAGFGTQLYGVDPSGTPTDVAPYLSVDRMFQQWQYPSEWIGSDSTDPAQVKDRSTWVGKDSVWSLKVDANPKTTKTSLTHADAEDVSWAMEDEISLVNMRNNYPDILPSGTALYTTGTLDRVHISGFDVDNGSNDTWAKNSGTWVYVEDAKGMGESTPTNCARPVQFTATQPGWVKNWDATAKFNVQPEYKGPKTSHFFYFKDDFTKSLTQLPYLREAWYQAGGSNPDKGTHYYGRGTAFLCAPSNAPATWPPTKRSMSGAVYADTTALWDGGAGTVSDAAKWKKGATLTSTQVIVPALKTYDPLKDSLGLCSVSAACYGSSWK